MQTVWAPAITTLLYLVIFTVALGRGGRTVMGVPFADFLAPGLIVMAMMQNAFANASFSLLVGKMQGNIVDYLMPPLSTGELIAGLVGAAVTRAFLVGFAVWLAMLLWPGVSVPDASTRCGLLWFGLMGALMLALHRAADVALGRQVRPCRGGDQLRRHPAVAAVGHLLFGRAAGADVPGDQPRQPVLLRDLGLPLRLPRRLAIRRSRSGRSGCCCSTSCCGRSATRFLRSGWKIKMSQCRLRVKLVERLITAAFSVSGNRKARRTIASTRSQGEP